MKNTALTLLFGFIFSFLYCEGMDVLLRNLNDAPVVNLAVICNGDASSIESADVICEEIKEDLIIRNTTWHSLEILSAVEVINGNVVIENNNLLNNINGLSQIKYVEKDFIINDNTILTESEVRRVILRILDDNRGYIGGSIIFNHTILDIEITVTTDI